MDSRLTGLGRPRPASCRNAGSGSGQGPAPSLRTAAPPWVTRPDHSAIGNRRNARGTLHLRLVAARGLRVADMRTSDPYVVFSCAGHQQRSRVIKRTVNPDWNQVRPSLFLVCAPNVLWSRTHPTQTYTHTHTTAATTIISRFEMAGHLLSGSEARRSAARTAEANHL